MRACMCKGSTYVDARARPHTRTRARAAWGRLTCRRSTAPSPSARALSRPDSPCACIPNTVAAGHSSAAHNNASECNQQDTNTNTRTRTQARAHVRRHARTLIHAKPAHVHGQHTYARAHLIAPGTPSARTSRKKSLRRGSLRYDASDGSACASSSGPRPHARTHARTRAHTHRGTHDKLRTHTCTPPAQRTSRLSIHGAALGAAAGAPDIGIPPSAPREGIPAHARTTVNVTRAQRRRRGGAPTCAQRVQPWHVIVVAAARIHVVIAAARRPAHGPHHARHAAPHAAHRPHHVLHHCRVRHHLLCPGGGGGGGGGSQCTSSGRSRAVED